MQSVSRLLALLVAAALLSHGWIAIAHDKSADSDTESVADVSDGEKATDQKEKPYKPKSKDELRRILTPMQYKVTQNEETEPAFRNKYWDNKQEGRYRCIVCDQDLFTSRTKYKSGTGWPSFYAPISSKNVGLRSDRKLFYTRIEVHCKRCGSHLGHVFDDGPQPTGKRYCMNSASLKFVESSKLEPKEKKGSGSKE